MCPQIWGTLAQMGRPWPLWPTLWISPCLTLINLHWHLITFDKHDINVIIKIRPTTKKFHRQVDLQEIIGFRSGFIPLTKSSISIATPGLHDTLYTFCQYKTRPKTNNFLYLWNVSPGSYLLASHACLNSYLYWDLLFPRDLLCRTLFRALQMPA